MAKSMYHTLRNDLSNFHCSPSLVATEAWQTDSTRRKDMIAICYRQYFERYYLP